MRAIAASVRISVVHNELTNAMYANVGRVAKKRKAAVVSDDEQDKTDKAAAATVRLLARPGRVMAGAAALAPVRREQVMAEAVVFTENLYVPESCAPQPNFSRPATPLLRQ